MAVGFNKIALDNRQFLVRWGNIAPGDEGMPFDAGGAIALSSHAYANRDGPMTVHLMASNEISAPKNAVSLGELATKGSASLAEVQKKARWYFPVAFIGVNTGSLDVVMLFQQT